MERDLAKADDALVAVDAAAADRALGDAEALLAQHPELPQAAWLLAEVLRARAARYSRLEPKDEARAAAAWSEAAGLDGGRLAGVVEKAGSGTAAVVTATVSLTSRDDRSLLWLDGASVTPGPISRSAGRHQLVATHDGATASAAWVDVEAGAELSAYGGGAAACSAEDLARAEVSPGHDTVQAAGVACPAWVAAVTTTDAHQIRVARCAGASCGPLVEWRSDAMPAWVLHPGGGGATIGEHAGFVWPTWATFTLVGVGVCAAVTVGVLAAAGVFGSAPVETRFVNGGVKVQSFGFAF